MPPPHPRQPHPPPPEPRPGQSPHHPPGPRPGVPASRGLSFVDEQALAAALAPLVPDAGDRAFVVRCLVGEGPIHHRGANYVLLILLARAASQRGHALLAAEGVPVPMRLPPHLAHAADDGTYPLALPTRALRELAGGDAHSLEAMIDCLTDGPPQHALANVAMMTLIESLLGPAAPAAAATGLPAQGKGAAGDPA